MNTFIQRRVQALGNPTNGACLACELAGLTVGTATACVHPVEQSLRRELAALDRTIKTVKQIEGGATL
jgi:hypothetical protein